MNQKAVVCFSGGYVSATLLHHAIREYSAVHALLVDHGQPAEGSWWRGKDR